MELLIVVSTPLSGPMADGLGRAAHRAGVKWGVFFTHDGVSTLTDPGFVATLSQASHAIACQESWQTHMGDGACPVELGSQTDHSKLAGQAKRIISF